MKGAQAAIAAALLLVAANGWSQSYPAKLVRLINPVAPGGNQDVVSRAYAEQMSKIFGQQVIVENRPGSAAVVGTRFVKTSPPDGYVLLTISNTFVRVPTLTPEAGYDPLKDFLPISQMADVPLVLVVNPALPVKTVKELIALAKKRPGEITSASSGVGSTGHVASEMLSKQAGIRLLHVQYKGAAPAVVDLVGGHVMLRFDQVTTSLGHINSGKLRALAVTTLKRSPVLPNVPTIDESAIRGFSDSTFNGLMAPLGTPRVVIDRMREATQKAAAIPELRARFLDQGIELVASRSSEEFGTFLRKQVEEFAVLARQVGMTEK